MGWDGWDGWGGTVHFFLCLFIFNSILLYFFSKPDKFIKDFSCIFEGDFIFLVNFFQRDFIYKIEFDFFL